MHLCVIDEEEPTQSNLVKLRRGPHILCRTAWRLIFFFIFFPFSEAFSL